VGQNCGVGPKSRLITQSLAVGPKSRLITQSLAVGPKSRLITQSLAVGSGAVAQTSISYWEKEKAWAVGAGFCRDSFG
jgi:hypothetical protein